MRLLGISTFMIVLALGLTSCLNILQNEKANSDGLFKDPNSTDWRDKPKIDISHDTFRPSMTLFSDTLIYQNPNSVDPELRDVNTYSLSQERIRHLAYRNQRLSQNTYGTPLLQVGGLVAEVSEDAYYRAKQLFDQLNVPEAPLVRFLGLGPEDNYSLYCENFLNLGSLCATQRGGVHGAIRFFELDILLHYIIYQIQVSTDPGTGALTIESSRLDKLKNDLRIYRQWIGAGKFSIIMTSRIDLLSGELESSSRTEIREILQNYPEIELLVYSPGEARAPECVNIRTFNGKPLYKVGIPSLSFARSQSSNAFTGYTELFTGQEQLMIQHRSLTGTGNGLRDQLDSAHRIFIDQPCQP